MSARRSPINSPHRIEANTASKTSARYRDGTAAASARTWARVITGRSGMASTPAPLIRQGLRAITSSSVAVFSTARKSRYALATVLDPTPPLINSDARTGREAA